jgi:SRSO17 transposase
MVDFTKGEAMEQISEAVTVQDVERWRRALEEVEQRVGEYFTRSEARYRAVSYIEGLLSAVERKNSWQLAERAGDATPYGLQHLLGRASWEADAVRDELQHYIADHLADPGAVVVIDETGFLKKGRHSAGVARQYSGTAGRVENCQVGVFLTYVSQATHTLLDRELYLPKEWISDPERCAQAGIPDDVIFRTKPALAQQMLARLLDSPLPVAWVTGDSVYGAARSLRLWLEEQEQAYVLGVSGKEYVWIGWQQQRISHLLKSLPEEGWTRVSAGDGSKGPRYYEWYRLPIGGALQESDRRWLLVRRSLSDPTDRKAFVAFAPSHTCLVELVRVAGTRWAIETDLQTAKGEVGLDHYEVRSWTGWYRHMTLALWAQAFLNVIRATELKVELVKKRALRRGSLAHFKAQRGLLSA